MGEYKVSELARLAGVSVRTIHHYESIGLLPRPPRSAGGHRLYDDQSAWRLTQIAALKALGLSLKEIQAIFVGDGLPAEEILQKQLDAARDAARHHQIIAEKLEIIIEAMDGNDKPSPSDIAGLSNLIAFARDHSPAPPKERLLELVAAHSSQEAMADWTCIIDRFAALKDEGESENSPQASEAAASFIDFMKRVMPGFESTVDSLDAPTLKKMLIEHQVRSGLASFISGCIDARLQGGIQ